MPLPPLLVAKGTQEIGILPSMANRHGLVAGASGTGKTVTLRTLAESFSSIGVPVFLADVKGDLSGIPYPGGDSQKVLERASKLGISPFTGSGFPVQFLDVFGKKGHPVRTSVSDMGPLLLARILDLNDLQTDLLAVLFRIADDKGLILTDMKDLQAMVGYLSEHNQELRPQYGNISPASTGAIQRAIISFEQEGGQVLFGEPALDIRDLIRSDPSGKGVISVLAADTLMQSQRIYATFLLYLLSELFEELPEVGDPEKPVLLFFFDEAHLLFADTPKILRERITKVVRLIRSKGVGVFFVTQNPADIPDDILGQLSHRFQHALRAFTEKDAKAIRAAAGTFRKNPAFDTGEVLVTLGVGEALVSVLDAGGVPSIVDHALIFPPRSRLNPLTDAERAGVIRSSPLYGKYETLVDRESAYEKITRESQEAPDSVRAREKIPGSTKTRPAPLKKTPSEKARDSDLLAGMAGTAAKTIGNQIARELVRGVLGSLTGGSRRR